MKRICTLLMVLAMALPVWSMSVAPATAEVVECWEDSDCDNGLGLYCTSKPRCEKPAAVLLPEVSGTCVFDDPCNVYPDRPICDQLLLIPESDPNAVAKACVECLVDGDCDDGICSNNVCVECVTDNDCGGGVCIDSECIECAEDADCAPWEACQEGECVLVGEPECLPEDNGPGGWNPDCGIEPVELCDPIPTCTADGFCDNSSNWCTIDIEDKGRGVALDCNDEDGCIWCYTDADCENWYEDCEEEETTGPLCTEDGKCRECITNADCPSSFCGGQQLCEDGFCVSDEGYDPCPDNDTEVCDEANERCVAECVDADDCYDIYGATDNFCDGMRVCNADGTCGLSGNPCPNLCLPEVEKCQDCSSDAQCDSATFPGKPFCEVIDEDNTKQCVECTVDTDCPAGQICVDLTPEDDETIKECVECIDDTTCPSDRPRCRIDNMPVGVPSIAMEVTESESNVCVECWVSEDCPEDSDGKPLVCNAIDCPEMSLEVEAADSGACPDERETGNGSEPDEFCTAVNQCVECTEDSDCMERLTDEEAPCNLDGTCVDSVCQYTNPCGDLECFPAGYYSVPGLAGVAAAELRDTFDYYCAECAEDVDCDDGLFCNGAEACVEGLCAAGTDPCADEGLECDEDNDTCVSVCELTVAPTEVRSRRLIGKLALLRISGSAGFDPSAEADLGDIRPLRTFVRGETVMILAIVPAGLPKGPLAISIGDCAGTIVIK